MLVSTLGRRLRAQVLNIGEIPATIVISENLPRRAGLPATPGRAAKRFDWTPGLELGAGGQPAAGSRGPAGSREASEIRVLNHWAAGLRSRLLPEVRGVATTEMCQKRPQKNPGLPYGFGVWRQGMIFLIALGGSRGCGRAFLLEACQQIVRWEASFKAKPFP